MNVLGVTHPVSYNTAACILVNGQLIACAEEERFIRLKHAFRHLPERAVSFCLEKACLEPKDVDVVAVGWEKSPKMLLSFDLFKNSLRSTGKNFKLERFRHELQFWTLTRVLDLELQTFLKRFQRAKIIYTSHHLAHVASAVFSSSFNTGIFMSLDNRGGYESGILGSFHNGNIETITGIPIDSSVGAMYEDVTGLLGFQKHSHEGKTMGLSAYGAPLREKFCEHGGQLLINVNWDLLRRAKELVNEQRGSDPTKDVRKDVAATVQSNLEETSLGLLDDLSSLTGYDRLVLAGGTALNCNMNSRLFHSELVKDVFIPPVANDAGVALGAAILTAIEFGDKPKIELVHAYWGPSYTDEEIEGLLKTLKVKYEYEEDIEGVAAESMSNGNIIGWFRGRMEIGPRALGARSILADPSDPEMKDKINYYVKNREWWRPFAPSVLEEYAGRYMPTLRHAPFMIITSRVREEHLEEIISATHIDKTCRPQTVGRECCPSYYKLIESFRKITGVPAILNTSFNIRGEPIVCSPRDAIRTFFSTGMDQLVLENFLIKKPLDYV